MKRTILLVAISMAAWHVQAQGTCATAVTAVLGDYYVSQINGPEAPTPVCSSGGGGATAGRWYSYTATIDTFITVTTDLPQNAGIDTRVQVYTGSCGNLSCYAGDDDSGSGNLAVTTFAVTAGTTYIIAFDNRWTDSAFTFRILKTAPAPSINGFSEQFVNTTGYAYCIVDMNGDGLDDAVSVDNTHININYQNAGGGFTNTIYTTTYADYQPSWSMCAGDLDGNGYNDLVYAGSGLTFMLANGDGTGYTELSQPEYIFCQRSNLVDINNDGNLDAFSCHDVAPNVYYINNGDGTYTWHQGGLGDTPDGGNYGSIWIDYNNDGNLDMFIAKCRGAQSPASIDQLWRNNGDGTFTDVAPENHLDGFQQSWSSAWGDFDNDGDMDVMIGASSFSGGGHMLMRNDGSTFTNITAGSGYDLFNGTSIEFITRDFNNDGYLDILGGGALMMNNGDMTFTYTNIPAGNGPTGDLNNDGFIDIQNGNSIWLNDGNDNNWIKIITTGTESNLNGIGARVEITSAMGTQIRDVRSGDGFRYMSSLTTHFGIGTDDAISNITIRWPSGIVNTVADPQINSTITVVEDPDNNVATGVASAPAAELSLFPSPVMNTLHIRSTRIINGDHVAITDMTGKEVARPALVNGTVDVSGLSSGIYLLKMDGASGTLTAKFTKE
ncbi:MAG: VCBS repeat-containing protein [Flavobacteriales bacterium]|jgi:hypothetical protein|nr:VCBS repeat-containing protein [Flavobacteriales bacterium]MBK7248446.1 VCBS repeat-containing protein [Flavobacteriales bacterium]MBK9059337.1 VCBS repeat-containing protein [Flavobacteriales bacterium]MBK9597724.1 VCBS repeat-containing protein [Flavobacteriales bacterium]QQS73698.1 MAG: VCBS repeat-containing protein [Flavobacteriales bacterium]